ncbi:MAG: OmpA family protein [Acidobacteriota bacterium]|nr:OmpA family protein [Acidobacteriota bacterium]
MASFRACAGRDPRQPYADFALARALLRARGREAYAEARDELRRFLEALGEGPPDPADSMSRGTALDLVRDLEELLASDRTAGTRERYPASRILAILLRPAARGASRYEGPRVPLRLGFRPDDWSLGSAAEGQLREAGRALNYGLLAASRIRIEGHTDDVEGGSRAGHQALARRRAEAALGFLIASCGVPPPRLSAAAMADDYPLAANKTEEGRAANRRVELVNLDEKTALRRDVRDPP